MSHYKNFYFFWRKKRQLKLCRYILFVSVKTSSYSCQEKFLSTKLNFVDISIFFLMYIVALACKFCWRNSTSSTYNFFWRNATSLARFVDKTQLCQDNAFLPMKNVVLAYKLSQRKSMFSWHTRCSKYSKKHMFADVIFVGINGL